MELTVHTSCYCLELTLLFLPNTFYTFFCFQIECLVLDEQFKKVSVYANHLLNWMTKHKACGIQGYYASNHPDKYSLLQVITTDAITCFPLTLWFYLLEILEIA